MSEEELIKFLKKPLKGKVCKALTQEDNKILLNYITRLQQENKQLQQRIDKATERINDIVIKVNSYNKKYAPLTFKLSETLQGEELLEILEGKNDRECCTKEHNKLFET